MGEKDVDQKISSTTCRLGTYIDLPTNQYRIPFNQRIYEWKKTETERLWKDFVNVSFDDGAEHMLNFITLVQEDDDSDCYIFDGQQRTLTCILIFAAIARKFKEDSIILSKNIEYKDIETRYNEAIKRVLESKIKLDDELNGKKKEIIQFYNEEDTELFYDVVTNYAIDKDLTTRKNNLKNESTQKNLMSNYINVINLLDEYMDSRSKDDILPKEKWTKEEWEEEYRLIENLYKSISHRIILIIMKVKNENMALQMFESLNNTGRDLEKYFVLKNEIYRNASSLDDNSKGKYSGKQTETFSVKNYVEKQWEDIDFNLEGINKGKFLKDVSTVRNGKSTKDNAYNKIIAEFPMEDKEGIEQLLRMLDDNSRLYRLIVNPVDNTLFTNDDNLKEYIFYSNCLSALGFKQHYPVLLSSMINGYEEDSIISLLKYIFSVSVRNVYFCGTNPNELEKMFAIISQGINDKSMTFDDVIHRININTKSDRDVYNQILEFSTTSNSKPRTLFNLIYHHCKSDDRGEIETSIDNNKVDLEHIFPKKPKNDQCWKKYFADDEERIKYTGKLGNMTLWYSKDNQLQKNALFSDKVKKYVDSQIFFTRMLAKNSEWGKKEIDRRTRMIAKTLIKIL